MEKIPVTAVTGPTASGKTRLAVELAHRFNAEVVSADSMQVYKGMDIATAKPTVEEMQGIKHHLVDFLDPGTPFSVAKYCALAGECISDIHKRGKNVVLAGGTGLYIEHLLENIQLTETPCEPGLREHLRKRLEDEGATALLKELEKTDSQTAARLHPNDTGRIIRALEIYYSSGITISEQTARSRLQPSPYDPLYLGLDFKDRGKLYERIDARVDKMLEDGLVEEAKAFLALPEAATASQAIGIKELQPYFNGECTLEHAVCEIKKSTRHYAKRQLTWFRRNDKMNFLFVDEYDSFDALAEAAAEKVKAFKR
ncbi:MAG: tRNA (adenosine(37)-N6)-dimethylallyltransferase MiaA [Clostridiales bacterium]|nr:tRNA (adenosine(37)-N6)-dimethylallyltransferase MiaA [Clostridiales bacterium]